MMKFLRNAVFLWTVAFTPHAALARTNSHAKSFKICKSSKKDFSTDCPSSWHRIDWQGNSISIINFPFADRDEGVIIKKDGAQIIINKNDLNGASFLNFIKDDSVGENISARPLMWAPIETPSCENISAVELKIVQGLGDYEVDDQVYCQKGQSVYKFQLRFWGSDKKFVEYKRVLKNLFDKFRVQ